MIRDKKVQYFYTKYKKYHKIIELELKDTPNNEYLASRILDKMIIYLFIKDNIKSVNQEELDIKECSGESLWIKLLNFYQEPLKKYPDESNLLRLIAETINENDIERKLHISNEVIEIVFKEFSKFRWILNSTDNEEQNCISPDILGDVFEKYLNQKDSGAYYTERDVVRYMNENSLSLTILNSIVNKNKLLELINSKLSTHKINNLEDLLVYNLNPFTVLLNIIEIDESNTLVKNLEEILNNLKLIDLTCGTGGFLIDSVDILYKIKSAIYRKIKIYRSNTEIVLNIIENNIYGVDIMNDAIAMAKFRLLLLILKYSINSQYQLPEKIEFNLFSKNILTPDFNFKNLHLSSDTVADCENLDCNLSKFINVINNGGFDCVVGNPPYIEYTKIKNQYDLDTFKTHNCKNIYAYVMERTVDILKEDGILSLIVPVSIVSTPRMNSLRELITDNFGVIFYSNFADRPGTLFNGVHQKTSIIIAKKDTINESIVYTTKYHHWYKEEREHLFKNIKYVKNNLLSKDYYPKLGTDLDINILNKINDKESSINSLISSTGKYTAYLNDRMCFWVKCFGELKDSNSFKKLNFDTDEEKWVFIALMNSNIFYYLWCIISDGWHITNKEIKAFKFDYKTLDKVKKDALIELAKKLEDDLENNKVYIGSKQVSYEYKHKKSKAIIDNIDSILKDYYKLNEQEYNHIIYCNLKYRMNDELESYLKIKTV